VASMCAAVSLPLWAWVMGYPWPVIVFGAVAAAGVLFLHRANVRRLWRGEESRFRLRRRPKPISPQA
jgi:acyl phosphate:glycerol-3-phosphate acyltransferase